MSTLRSGATVVQVQNPSEDRITRKRRRSGMPEVDGKQNRHRNSLASSFRRNESQLAASPSPPPNPAAETRSLGDMGRLGHDRAFLVDEDCAE